MFHMILQAMASRSFYTEHFVGFIVMFTGSESFYVIMSETDTWLLYLMRWILSKDFHVFFA